MSDLLSKARQSSCKLLTSTNIGLNTLQMQFKYIRVSVQEDNARAHRVQEMELDAAHRLCTYMKPGSLQRGQDSFHLCAALRSWL